jgi:hypothetical protein
MSGNGSEFFAQSELNPILTRMCKPFNYVILLFVSAFWLSLVSPARAWIDCGHKIVSIVAWDELTPKTKAAVIEILKQHPRFDKDLLAMAPKDAAGDDLDRHIFASAAIWPDLVRAQSNPMHTAYNHPAWHYIDIPFVVDNQPVPKPRPTTRPGPQNIVEALQKVTTDVKDPNISASDKAVAMCWIIHLVGDIHQPLHAASLYSPQYPKGDQGGNNQLVLRDPPYADSKTKLHLLWDELPGQFKSEDMDSYEAGGLLADKRFSREMMKDELTVTDFTAWANESHLLAVKYAYLDGKLKTAVAPPRREEGADSGATDKAPAPPEELVGSRAKIPGVPQGYLEQSEEVAMHQVVLGGYRLANLLNAMFE